MVPASTNKQDARVRTLKPTFSTMKDTINTDRIAITGEMEYNIPISRLDNLSSFFKVGIEALTIESVDVQEKKNKDVVNITSPLINKCCGVKRQSQRKPILGPLA